MFARGVLSLHAAPLSVPKTPASNSRVSITSKLIDTKRLQVLHSGHLRKTGGRGSYQFAKGYLARPPTLRATEHGPQSLYHSPACPERGRRLHPERRIRACPPKLQRRKRACPPKLQRRRAISFISPTYDHQSRMSFVSPTYAKTGGYTPTQKCRRADIPDFSPDISHFSRPKRMRRSCPSPP